MKPMSRRAALATLGATPLLFVGLDAAQADSNPDRSALAKAFASGTTAVPTLAVSSSSPYSNIMAVQYLLSAWGVPTTADGHWGPQTTKSVRTFQAKKKLSADGLAGPKTMGALINTPGFPGSTNQNTTKAVQRLLVKIGYRVSVDGSYGPATTAAAKAFQKRVGISQTGRVDTTTWSYLFEPPPAPSGTWTQAFMTQQEDYSGINANALTAMQTRNLQFIIAVGKGHQVPARGIQVAIDTAIVESWLYNRYSITDGTSGGLYQQQTSSGWGTAAQVRNKLLATKAFFGIASHTSNRGLADYYPAYLNWSIAATAQKIQASARPDRYQTWSDTAVRLYTTYAPGVVPYSG